MMLDFLGEHEAATLLMRAIGATILDGRVLTPDLGGHAPHVDMYMVDMYMYEVDEAFCRHIRQLGRE